MSTIQRVQVPWETSTATRRAPPRTGCPVNGLRIGTPEPASVASRVTELRQGFSGVHFTA